MESLSIQPGSPTKPRALITGISGQDGFYLAEWLLQQGYAVFGTTRLVTQVSPKIRGRLAGVFVADLIQSHQLMEIVRRVQPHEVYHLAAYHFSSQRNENSLGQLEPFVAVNLRAADCVLQILRDEMPSSRFFYAASAHIFGVPAMMPQTEEMPHHPDTLYAISKSAGVHLCRYYRTTFGIFAAAGILYNHESPRRRADFVTTQIAHAAARAALGSRAPLVLRDLDAVVDWGAAQDYVRAMWLILQQPRADEYIIASGVPRTVREFAQVAFDAVGLRADDFVFQSSQDVPPARLPYVGDNSKLRQVCGWEPTFSFHDLVRAMVLAQVDELKRSSA